jgi:hypothetical protein
LRFFVATGDDLFKGLNRARLAVDTQFKVFFRQPVNKTALLVENHHVGLDEFSVNTYNLIRGFLRRRLCGLRGSFRTRQERAEQKRQRQESAKFEKPKHKTRES